MSSKQIVIFHHLYFHRLPIPWTSSAEICRWGPDRRPCLTCPSVSALYAARMTVAPTLRPHGAPRPRRRWPRRQVQAGSATCSLESTFWRIYTSPFPCGQQRKTQKYSKCSTRRKYEGLPSPGCSDPKLLRLRVKLASRFVTTESPQSAVEPAAAPSDEGRDCLQWSPLEGAPGQVAKGPLLEMSLLSLGRVRSIHAPKHLLYPEPADEECILIGDYSKKHLLPIAGMHHLGLHCVLAQTVASLITGKFSAAVEDFLIVDCRYPYEYQGGHIKGAVNLHTEAQLHRAFHHGLSHSQLSPTTGPKLSLSGDTTVLGMRRLSHGDESQSNSSPDIPAESSPRKLVVFHCEFSSERGPRLCRYLRELDRKVNAGRYPLLYHPEIYLLQGGYKQFYNSFPELCEPHGYVPMRHKEFREQLHRFHQKKRSRQCRRVLFK